MYLKYWPVSNLRFLVCLVCLIGVIEVILAFLGKIDWVKHVFNAILRVSAIMLDEILMSFEGIVRTAF